MAVLRTSYDEQVASLGPLAHWRFNETAGRTAIDRADGFDGTYNGSPQLVDGIIGDGAARFDGSGTFVEIVTASAGAVRLAFLGDSYVAGFGVAPEDAFPNDLEGALESEGFIIQGLNFGEVGRFTSEALALMPDVLAAQPNAAILVLGANDSLNGVGPAETEANLRQIIEQLQANDVEVLLTGTFGLWPNETFDRPGYDTTDPDNALALADQFEAIFPALAAELDVPLFDPFLGGERVGEEIVGGVLGDPALNLGDGVHPNAAGVDAIVERILPQARSLVEAAGAGAEPGDDPLALPAGSIEMWFVPAALSGTQALFSKDADGLGAGQVRAVLTETGRVRVQLEGATDLAIVQSAAGALTPGSVAHLVFTFGPDGVRLFLNGEQVDQDGDLTGGLVGNGQALIIGRALAADDFDGTVDEFAIYDQALAPADVFALFRAGLSDGDLVGTGGPDTLIGDAAANVLLGAGGADTLVGKAGDDELRGGGGADELFGGDGNDGLFGGRGDDILGGGPGDDRLDGKAGSDRLSGGQDNDTLLGRGGGDILAGRAGDDVLLGHRGADDLRGGAGDDQLSGGPGGDVLRGGPGQDLLDGGPGLDTLIGGAGSDTFHLTGFQRGVDEVLDFEAGPGGDRLDVSAVLDGFEPGVSDAAAFVRLSEANGSTQVAVDARGGGSAGVPVFDLVAVTGLDVGQLVTDGNLILEA